MTTLAVINMYRRTKERTVRYRHTTPRQPEATTRAELNQKKTLRPNPRNEPPARPARLTLHDHTRTHKHTPQHDAAAATACSKSAHLNRCVRIRWTGYNYSTATAGRGRRLQDADVTACCERLSMCLLESNWRRIGEVFIRRAIACASWPRISSPCTSGPPFNQRRGHGTCNGGVTPTAALERFETTAKKPRK